GVTPPRSCRGKSAQCREVVGAPTNHLQSNLHPGGVTFENRSAPTSTRLTYVDRKARPAPPLHLRGDGHCHPDPYTKKQVFWGMVFLYACFNDCPLAAA